MPDRTRFAPSSFAELFVGSLVIQFLVILRDATDSEASKRRQAIGPQHRARAEKLQERGHMVMGGAVLGEDGMPVGSAAFVQFESRAALDEWFTTDPYRTANVWASMEVHEIRIAAHYGVKPPCEPK